MTGARRLALGTSALFAIAVLGCERPNAEEGRAEHQPVAIADQEDEVCGMLVREQSAPRSQIVHRDGSRVFFCSLGDMLVHLGAPSPRGRAEALFVEVMAPHEDPMQTHAGPHEWVEAIMAAGEKAGGKVDWINCGLCVDERGVHETVEGARRGTPGDFWKWSDASDNTLVIPTK